jgi:hypothetical protein
MRAKTRIINETTKNDDTHDDYENCTEVFPP